MVALSAILAKQSWLLHPDPDIKAYEYYSYSGRKGGFNIDMDFWKSIKLYRPLGLNLIYRELPVNTDQLLVL